MNDHQLASFWAIPVAQRAPILLDAVAETHAWHYERNNAYRRTVAARGVGPRLNLDNGSAESSDILPRLLRPTAQTFKSYIEVLGTPFAQERPHAFVEWLSDQLSVELPRDRFGHLRRRYGTLEALLQGVERLFTDLGLEISTSSGTSGRSTIMVRDQESLDKTVESFYLAFQRYLGMKAEHQAIFIMPRQTRIAMARMASFSVRRIGLTEAQVHFTIPFPAEPDRVRVRAGRTFRPGWRGVVERRLWHPIMGWMQERYVNPHAVSATLDLLRRAATTGDKVLVFGGWVQLHAIAQRLQAAGPKLRLAPGSLFGTGGGLKELYPFSPVQIRRELERAAELVDGRPIPIRDVYGMAEGNWAAMQCHQGNYHVPPWVYTVTLDEDGRIQRGPDRVGLLAFFDPYGGGRLFPAFFRTSDQVRLINGNEKGDPALDCPCGEAGTYIVHDSIERVDLRDEAGCAAQI